MRKIINPFLETKSDEYNCFGCSPHNSHGLNLRFWEDGEYLVSNIQPANYLQGYPNVIHGGIQATLHDEIAAWFVYAKVGTTGVTASINVTYRKPALMDQGALTLKAKLVEDNRRMVTIHTQLFSANGVLSSEASVKYMIFPLDVAITKYHYPGKDAFYEKE